MLDVLLVEDTLLEVWLELLDDFEEIVEVTLDEETHMSGFSVLTRNYENLGG